jgi:hypothetical protein
MLLLIRSSYEDIIVLVDTSPYARYPTSFSNDTNSDRETSFLKREYSPSTENLELGAEYDHLENPSSWVHCRNAIPHSLHHVFNIQHGAASILGRLCVDVNIYRQRQVFFGA